MSAPGHVRHHGRGELIIGPSPASADIAAALEHAAIPTRVSDAVTEALWTKLIVNCAFNALSAIGQRPYGRLIQMEGVVEVMRDVVGECVEVAARCGVSVPADVFATVMGIAASMPNQYSSTAQDLARGKRTEIDHLNGYVVREAAEFGLSTPANRTLLVVVKGLESKAVI
jgi:2-dehydropantoate 2-reductase